MSLGVLHLAHHFPRMDYNFFTNMKLTSTIALATLWRFSCAYHLRTQNANNADKDRMLRADKSHRKKKKKAKVHKKKKAIREYGKEFEGDIKVLCNQIRENYGMEEVKELVHNGKLHPSCLDDGKRDLALMDVDKYWDNRRGDDGVAIIPYQFDDSFDSDINQMIVTSSLNDLAKKSGVIRFVKRTTETPYINVMGNDDGCWSYVGRVATEKQPINLSQTCVHNGVVQHEFLHALGFWHEQSRPDRDDYVTVVEENIVESDLYNFHKQTGANSRGSPYDYGSIMHYPKKAFSKNDKETIIANNGESIGQRVEASHSDIVQVRLLYQCLSGPRTLEDYNESPCTDDCKCWGGATGCGMNDNACQGNLVCSDNQCISGSPTAAPTPIPRQPCVSVEFNAGYGDCSTYQKGTANNAFCAVDKHQKDETILAIDACSECGFCSHESQNTSPTPAPSSVAGDEPTSVPTYPRPVEEYTSAPTINNPPTCAPKSLPTGAPTRNPTLVPTKTPTLAPTDPKENHDECGDCMDFLSKHAGADDSKAAEKECKIISTDKLVQKACKKVVKDVLKNGLDELDSCKAYDWCPTSRMRTRRTAECEDPPTSAPTSHPTETPDGNPTMAPTGITDTESTSNPTSKLTLAPTKNSPCTCAPTSDPTGSPTRNPTSNPTNSPTLLPTKTPTLPPTDPKQARDECGECMDFLSKHADADDSKAAEKECKIISTDKLVQKACKKVVKDVLKNGLDELDSCKAYDWCPTSRTRARRTAGAFVPLDCVCEDEPTSSPTMAPTGITDTEPTSNPTSNPTNSPTDEATVVPNNNNPTSAPTGTPTRNPTTAPTRKTTFKPTTGPTSNPTNSPTDQPTSFPTFTKPVEEECADCMGFLSKYDDEDDSKTAEKECKIISTDKQVQKACKKVVKDVLKNGQDRIDTCKAYDWCPISSPTRDESHTSKTVDECLKFLDNYKTAFDFVKASKECKKRSRDTAELKTCRNVARDVLGHKMDREETCKTYKWWSG